MIKIYYKSVKEKEISEIEDFKIGSLVYVESPSEEELVLVSNNLGFNFESLKDALDMYEVPRLEIEGNNVYFYSRIPYELEKAITTIPLLVAINENFILTVSSKELNFLKEIINQGDFNTTQRAKCFFQIFSHIDLIYGKVLTNINKRVRKFTIALEKISDKEIRQFVFFETILNDFLSALIPMSTALNQLLQNKILKLYEEDKDLIENLNLANIQLIELAKSNLKNIVNIREAYSTILTNDLNQIIKIFTALTVIVNLPVIIASFYGMNVKLPFEDHPYIFYWLVVLNLSIVILLIILFIRKKWL